MNCEVREIENDFEKDLVRMLIRYYHAQGLPIGGGAGKNSRYFMYVCDGFITAVAWLHDNTPFHFIASHFNIPNDRTYFIRRITKTAPGDYLVRFLQDLSEKLKNNGFEYLWTLGFDDHSNALYKKAGFKFIGETSRTHTPVFVKQLNY